MPRKTDEPLRLTREQSLTVLCQSNSGRQRRRRQVSAPTGRPASSTRAHQDSCRPVQGMEAPALLLHLAGLHQAAAAGFSEPRGLAGADRTRTSMTGWGARLELHVVGAPGTQHIASPHPPPRPPTVTDTHQAARHPLSPHDHADRAPGGVPGPRRRLLDRARRVHSMNGFGRYGSMRYGKRRRAPAILAPVSTTKLALS